VHTPDLYDGRTFETYEDGSAHSETLAGPMAIVERARAEVGFAIGCQGLQPRGSRKVPYSLPSKATSGRRPYGRGDRLVALGDSANVVNQITRGWNKNVRASELYEEVEEALKPFKTWQLSWVPREMNREADKLVDQAFKGEPVIHATD
jgi:Reverse transcriptase-like